jgi:hypothetical protein
MREGSDQNCRRKQLIRLPGAPRALSGEPHVHVTFGGPAAVVDDANEVQSGRGRPPINALPSNQKTRRTSAATLASSAMPSRGADTRSA